ncbi:MAG: 16S rRNA (uracil(1498)-N(3))-methyltransferase [Neisseriaceae bacterium]
MPRFYVNLQLDNSKTIELPTNVVQHLHALRLVAGMDIELFNGNGYSYLANLIEINKKYANVAIINKCESNNNILDIRLAISTIANDKMDFVMQKATELGVKQITPIISKRTQQVSSERMGKKLIHWHNIIISSCEQCGLNNIPKLNQVETFTNFIQANGSNEESMNIILSPYRKNEDNFNHSKLMAKYITLIVGPEGGFTDDEIEFATNNNFKTVRLGNLTMRAETAAIAGIITIQTKFGNWVNA